MSDTVITIRIQLFTNIFRGRVGFYSFVIHRVGSTEFSWLNALETFATKLGCPRKIRLEIKVIFLFFRSGSTFIMF